MSFLSFPVSSCPALLSLRLNGSKGDSPCMSPSHPRALSPPRPLSRSHRRRWLIPKFNSDFGFGFRFIDHQDKEVDGSVGCASIWVRSPVLCLSVPICRETEALLSHQKSGFYQHHLIWPFIGSAHLRCSRVCISGPCIHCNFPEDRNWTFSFSSILLNLQCTRHTQ